jgi:tetratricopeptide (TPR) repeat protein
MQAMLIATLRDILCANLSLDDGLSAVQIIPFNDIGEANTLFDIARAIEEIILRRPGLASAKLTELSIRLSFHKNRLVPELLLLLDTRYTNGHRRSECEILPDIEAIPHLIDILGELSQALSSSIRLNLRPLLPFLADEVLMTLNAIYDRRHDGTTTLALYEIHNLAWILIKEGFFEGAELLLNRLIEISNEIGQKDLSFEVTFDYACVLTELHMFEAARTRLNELEIIARAQNDRVRLAEVILQLGVNETRDENVDHSVARDIGDKAAELYDLALKDGLVDKDEVGLAHLIIGSNILVNGWREGVHQAIDRLQLGLAIFYNIEEKNPDQRILIFRTLASLGFAHGLLGDHDNMTKAIEYFNEAKEILHNLEAFYPDIDLEIARTENAIGWSCLCTECDEFWSIGLTSFEMAVKLRESQFADDRVSEIELIGTRMGLALSQMRAIEKSNLDIQDPLCEILGQYLPLSPTDTRAIVEMAIASYNVVWFLNRHGGNILPKLTRLLDDIDRILIDARVDEESMFIHGVSLIVPFLENSWNTLLERSKMMSDSTSPLADVAGLTAALSTAKLNLDALNLEVGVRIQPPVDDAVQYTDPLLAQYWLGQTYLVQTIRAFYDNKDYSELATGFYGAAIAFGAVASIEPTFLESSEFIKATSSSISQVLRRFALALENQYAAYIDRGRFQGNPVAVGEDQYDFLLDEDWLGLIKIANSYLQMVEQSEMVEAQPYLNAVFSNLTRALRIIDRISLVDRRVLSTLGNVMNKRFYLRR